MNNHCAVALFSGGLDSILAARLIMEQGIEVKCLHFVSPFFGNPRAVGYWHRTYGLDIDVVDVSDVFVSMLRARPAHGFGKVMNPCVDCKILMLSQAKIRMKSLGASFIISGSVLGQRPMSQRKDALNIIVRDSDTKAILLRPLCAQCLPPTPVELSGIVDRNRLKGFSGRGRNGQLQLAEQLGITSIPTPAGGCKLCEKENARRYWTVLTRMANPEAADFVLSNIGRQLFSETFWLAVGRNSADNEVLQGLGKSSDYMLKVMKVPGPVAVLRSMDGFDCPSVDELKDAASVVASFTPKVANFKGMVSVSIRHNDQTQIVEVPVGGPTSFHLPEYEDIQSEIHAKPEISEKKGRAPGISID